MLYYHKLTNKNKGIDEYLLEWSEYVLRGLLNEMQKIDKLLDYKFLAERILRPSIQMSLQRKIITELEAKILYVAIDKEIFRASDIKSFTLNKIPAERSRILNKMRSNKFIKPVSDGARQYAIQFTESLLSRALIQALANEGFITVD